MRLYSGPTSAQSHRVRIVMAEKDIAIDIVDVGPDGMPGDVADLNPYNDVPTLVERDLALYGTQVILEYLDERYPHPPLMPVDPVQRAAARLALYRLERDWYGLVPDLESGNQKAANTARKIMRERLIVAAEVFAAKPYFLSDEFSLVDCTVLPILWRLRYWDIELPPQQTKPIRDYALRLFSRPSFRQSLTQAEREMRPRQ